MIVLGVVLLVIGAVVAYFGRGREPVAFGAGVLIAAAGAILLLIGVLDTSDAAAATLPLLGMTTLHGAGDGEDAVPVKAGSIAKSRPVLLAFLLAGVPIVSAFALQVLEQTDVLDSAAWLRTLLVGLGALTGALGAAWSQAQVTPLAVPKTSDGEPLVPIGDPVVTGEPPSRIR